MSVNKVLLLGNLGQNPELRYSQTQTAICRFSIATAERQKGADGNWTEKTEWHKIVTFGRVAENCGKYLQKGKQVFVDGRIQTSKWQDQEGKDRYTTEIIANEVQFIGGSKGEGIEIERSNSNYSSDQSNNSESAAPVNTSALGKPVSFEDDDIPF
jgi:single-strand DNA-binding protein